jgi:DNA-binding Lrp family transcriptional regulator
LARLLAFVNILVESPMNDNVVQELKKLPSVQELYEVTGDFDVACLVSTSGIEGLREILVDRIMKIKGVRSTVTSLVLYSHEITAR